MTSSTRAAAAPLPRLPLTVIGGYLGAGKTTLINRLLAEDHGRRVMVMVNDFGAVNLDASLIRRADGDTIELTNGCVCCTMGGDLFLAMGDALDRRPRPDHLVIEASGIADPARIAAAARTEPELRYGGIAVLVDAENFGRLAGDARIGPQIRGQVAVADLLLVSKSGAAVPPALSVQLAALNPAPQVALSGLAAVAPLLLDGIDPAAPRPGAGHGQYVSWSGAGQAMTRAALDRRLRAAPEGLYRIKGVIGGPDGGLEFHKVGPSIEITRCAAPEEGRIVGIGPADRIKPEEIAAWWTA